MHFKSVAIALACLASSAYGVQFTSIPTNVQAGQTYTITWADGSGPATILLREGDPNNLQTVATITTTGTGGSYSWTAPSDLANAADYAFQITDSSGTNYSGQFAYSGGSGTASLPASASASASVSRSIITSTLPSTSALPSTGAKNSTATKTSSKTSVTLSTTGGGPTASNVLPPSSGAALRSPLALVLGAVAAMLYLQ